jgi:cobyrinic acid a,c-diamide synthase
MHKRPRAHGYSVALVDRPNPFYPVGTRLQGHEFHYSAVSSAGAADGVSYAFAMERGEGIVEGRDGICYNNVLATYTHTHALGTPLWAESLIRKAEEYHG